ncbi:MAG: hypothetical protein AABY96_17110 [Nitrospirota bacterium]
MIRKLKSGNAPNLKFDGDCFNAITGILNPDEGLPVPVPLFKGKGDMLNLPHLTKADVAEIDSGESYLVTFGSVTYSDAYGTSHWINFCSYQTRSPGKYNPVNCAQYNKVDNN